MAHQTVTLFFALLAVALTVVIGALGLSALVDRADRLTVRAQLRPVALEGAAAVAVVSTAGSLYLSEIAGFVPCRLCWIQRGFMYPAAVLLVVAVVTGRHRAGVAAAGLALVGLPVALFHRLEQAAGEVGAFCDPSAPCSSRWVDHFGFVTIPTMAAVGFAGIVALVALVALHRPLRPSEPSDRELSPAANQGSP